MTTSMPLRIRLMTTFLLGASVLFSSAVQSAEVWPNKPIKIIVPFSPGSVQDALARSFSNELGAALGEVVIVENKAGAGGTVGTGIVAKSNPDGYTFLLAAASHNKIGRAHV